MSRLHKRIFVRHFGAMKRRKIPHDHQNMLIHRVDMEQIVLHLSHNAAERRQIPPEDAVAVHQSQSMGQPPTADAGFP